MISVQVLNEFSSIATGKLAMSIAETREALSAIRSVCAVVPLTAETHDSALAFGERYSLSVYDATIVAAAALAGCRTLVTEDLQDGQVFERDLVVRDPFR